MAAGNVAAGGDVDAGRGEARLRGRVRRLERVVAVLALALVAAVGWILLRPAGSNGVLTAERLEIVEPDGRPAFVLSNSARPTVGTIDGRVLMEDQAEERRMPNFIFFDGHGDEVGGMLFGNRTDEDGFSATRHLSLDGYKQDQTVRLFHRQDPEGAASGLSVTDRPEERSLRETMTALGLEVPHTREEASEAIARIPEAARADSLRELFGVNRLFLGSSDRDEATLSLKDGKGRPRIVLGVPEDGDPYVRILDEDGDPVTELP